MKVRSNIDGDDVLDVYRNIQNQLEKLRAEMCATWNRFPHQTGWPMAIQRLDKVNNAIDEAVGWKDRR